MHDKELLAVKARYLQAKAKAIEHAPILVREICQRMSLRDLAKKVNRSPTYLSQIATGKVRCSEDCYLDLCRLK